MLANTQDIINKFELYTGDTTELSSQDELDLANKVYRKIQNDRPWQWLKKTATGTITVANGIATITPPSDFSYFAENFQATNIAQEPHGNESPKVIWVATTSGLYDHYHIVNFSDGRMYLNEQGFCWYDMANNVIQFAALPTETDLSYEFDYIYVPVDLTLTTGPVFPAQFWDIIFHGMCTDDLMIQLFDRTHSYEQEHLQAYMNLLNQMQFQNAELQMY